MVIRDLIRKIEEEKDTLLAENKALKEEIAELKKINKKLVDDWNTKYAPADADKVESEDGKKEDTPVDEVVEEPKPKRNSRKKKTDVEEVVSLM